MPRPGRFLAAIRRQHRQERVQPCWRCGLEIDYDAAWPAWNAYTLGHKKPWSRYPALRYDPSNVAPEHYLCNQTAKDDDVPALGKQSREW